MNSRDLPQYMGSAQTWGRVPPEIMSRMIDGGIDEFYSAVKRPVMKNLCREHRQFYHLRFKAFMFILIDTGCRPDELLKVELCDLPSLKSNAQQTPKQFLKTRPPSDAPKIVFRFTKNGNTRAVPLSPLSIAVLKSWLYVRPTKHGAGPADLLFTACPKSDMGTMVDYRGQLRTLYKLQEYLGLQKTDMYSFYCFRRTTASAMAKDDLVNARDYLGQMNISTTNTYLYTTEESIAESHARVAPLERYAKKK